MPSILPELDGLDERLALYAAVGMCVSEAAEIEWYLFECYFLASGLELEDAVREFHRAVNFKHKRSVTDAAMQGYLDGDDLKAWTAILQEVQTVCGPDGARNLVSHNPVRASIYAPLVDPLPGEALFRVVPEILQNPHLVRAKMRRDRAEDVASLSDYVRALRGALASISDFWSALTRAIAERD